MGLSKRYSAAEAKAFFARAKFETGQVVRSRSCGYKDAEVEEIMLSVIDRGALLYRVRFSRCHVATLPEEDLYNPPESLSLDGSTNDSSKQQQRSPGESESQLGLFACG
tara:strand:- start:278 stop:604 length:327 start_codon:yes stop_codon:yes gene_type:complete